MEIVYQQKALNYLLDQHNLSSNYCSEKSTVCECGNKEEVIT